MIRQSFLLALALIGCEADSHVPPDNAGVTYHECTNIKAPPDSPATTFHRGTWDAALQDAVSGLQLARVHAEWTFADVDHKPTMLLACVDVLEVHRDIAVETQWSAQGMAITGKEASVLISIRGTVQAPAVIRNGTRLNYPHARFDMNIESGAAWLDLRAGRAHDPAFRPDWGTSKLGFYVTEASIKQIARPMWW